VRERFRDLPAAITNAVALAEMCRSDVLPRGLVMPPARVPQNQDAQGHLRELCERAFRQRSWSNEPGARKRLEHELLLIGERDLAPYFLVVGDLAEECQRRAWPMALRGSAGASLVCYLLGITNVDPLAHGLRVERFLNPLREDFPDIDLELASQVRQPAFKWLLGRYGHEHVARVGVVEHYGVRSAFQDAAAAHGLQPAQTRALMDELGDDLDTLREPTGLAATPPSWSLEAAQWPKLVTAARTLLGRPSGIGTHPSGVVLSGKPVEDLVAVQKGPGGVRLSLPQPSTTIVSAATSLFRSQRVRLTSLGEAQS
jgi:DNA polymerase III alpha subunit